MKVAVLSDIHGNHIALKKCIEEIERRKIKKLIFLGDYVGELAYPQKTMAYLRKIMMNYECYFIRGNKEDYWIEREHDSKGKKLKLNTDDSHILFEDTAEAIILCGHTHIRNKIIREGRVLLNPGSVGVPLESHGISQFMILSGEQGKWEYEYIDMSYDIESVIRELHEENLYVKAPYWTRITEYVLRNGNISHGTVLARAMQLLYNDTGKWCWPDIPEEYWERAIGELIRN